MAETAQSFDDEKATRLGEIEARSKHTSLCVTKDNLRWFVGVLKCMSWNSWGGDDTYIAPPGMVLSNLCT